MLGGVTGFVRAWVTLHMVPEVCQLPRTWCEPETDFPTAATPMFAQYLL